MATIKEIVYDLKNIIRGGLQSDDEMISDRQIEFQITISDNIKQIIHCLEMEEVPASICGLPGDEMIMRSKRKIPNPIETSHQDLITAIGPSGLLSLNFHMIPYNRAPWARTNKYTKLMTCAFVLDSFIYVVGNNAHMLETIKVEGVWQDPKDIAEYTLHDNVTSSYNPETEEYPISISILDLIKQATNNAKADFQPNQRR